MTPPDAADQGRRPQFRSVDTDSASQELSSAHEPAPRKLLSGLLAYLGRHGFIRPRPSGQSPARADAVQAARPMARPLLPRPARRAPPVQLQLYWRFEGRTRLPSMPRDTPTQPTRSQGGSGVSSNLGP